jgi:exosortase/archaeosortase family protein
MISFSKQANKRIFRLLLILLFYLVVVETLIQHTDILIPLQVFETHLVASLQSLFSIPVSVSHGFVLSYSDIDLDLVVGPLCTGIREMFLFVIIVLPLGIKSLRKRLNYLLLFLFAIFMENILRLSILYPMAKSAGVGSMYSYHDFIWVYGQAIFLAILLVLWFYIFPRVEKDPHKKDKPDRKKADLE